MPNPPAVQQQQQQQPQVHHARHQVRPQQQQQQQVLGMLRSPSPRPAFSNTYSPAHSRSRSRSPSPSSNNPSSSDSDTSSSSCSWSSTGPSQSHSSSSSARTGTSAPVTQPNPTALAAAAAGAATEAEQVSDAREKHCPGDDVEQLDEDVLEVALHEPAAAAVAGAKDFQGVVQLGEQQQAGTGTAEPQPPPLFLARFRAGWVHASLGTVAVSCLEKQKRWEEAVEVSNTHRERIAVLQRKERSSPRHSARTLLEAHLPHPACTFVCTHKVLGLVATATLGVPCLSTSTIGPALPCSCCGCCWVAMHVLGGVVSGGSAWLSTWSTRACLSRH